MRAGGGNERDEAHATFGQPAGGKALPTESVPMAARQSVKIMDLKE
jgi:hypothetical protein